MWIIATVLNIAVIVISIILTIDEWGSIGAEQIPIIVCFFACPIVNLYYIMFMRAYKSPTGWVGLYFKRKSLEERKKIEALTNDKEPRQKESP